MTSPEIMRWWLGLTSSQRSHYRTEYYVTHVQEVLNHETTVEKLILWVSTQYRKVQE